MLDRHYICYIRYACKENNMNGNTDICAVCAWRADCQKKFSVSGRGIRCADFVKDELLKNKESEQDKEESNT